MILNRKLIYDTDKCTKIPLFPTLPSQREQSHNFTLENRELTAALDQPSCLHVRDPFIVTKRVHLY